MRDVVKTNVKRNQNSKRTRRRRRNIPLYFFLVMILVAAVGIILSVTLFFNIKKINVKGDVDYSSEDIIRVSGIGNGDNMVRLDAKKAEKSILDSMIFIEEAEINKKYPDTLEINVTRCVPSANIQCEGGYLLVSGKGKILEKVENPQKDIFVVNGLEPMSETPGTYIKSVDEQKTEIYFDFFEYVNKNEKNKIQTIDLSDKYDIKTNYDNRITFEMGNANEIVYKLELAETVLKDLNDDKKGTMVMIGTNQISFRSDSESMPNNSTVKIPIKEEDLPDGYTEETQSETDESQDSEDYYNSSYIEEPYENGNEENNNDGGYTEQDYAE